MRCSNCGNQLPDNALFCDNCGYNMQNNTEKSFCGNCGAELENGARFCAECGAVAESPDKSGESYVFCGNCGAKMSANLQICTNCGEKIYAESTPDNVKKPSGKKYVVIIIALAAVILALAAVIVGYFYYNNQDDVDDAADNLQVATTPKTTAAPTAAPSAAPENTQNDSAHMGTNVGKLETYYVVNCNTNISLRESPTTSSKVLKEIPLGAPVSYVEFSQNGFAKIIYNGTTGYALQSYLSKNADDIRRPNNQVPDNNNTSTGSDVISNPTYKTYNDTDYNFSCAYPSHFQVYNENDNFVRYSLKAPNNTATLKICATKNTSNLSVATVMDNFKTSYPGTVDYENSGDTWCVINTEKNGQSHYGYFSLKGGMIRGFEMHYAQANASIYDSYIKIN